MAEKEKYQICTRCVMDTTATEIKFDEKGVCNFCTDFEEYAAKTIWRDKEIKEKELKADIQKIKDLGKGKKYDCLIGLSGGVDSSYLCYWAKQEGLRPLIVHFDNGWDSELAVKNVENIVSKTGFDLYSYVIDWREFKDLQLSYIKAGVLDLEVPTDQLIFAALFRILKTYNIKSLVRGHNSASEFILPGSWCYRDKFDYVNLTEIHKKFGTTKLHNFPKLDLTTQQVFGTFYKVNSIAPLELLDYDKEKAKKILMSEFDWRDYGGKHYESIFTRFYQGYILPRRFNIDKRRAHISNLVMSKIITRDAALEELKKPPYDLDLQKQDYEYVIKKFEITEEEFEKYMTQPIVPHEFYGTQWDKKHFRKHFLFKKFILPVLKVIAKFKS